MAETLFRQWFVEEEKEEWRRAIWVKLLRFMIILEFRCPKWKEIRKKMDNYIHIMVLQEIMDYINDYIFDGEYILLGEDGTVRRMKVILYYNMRLENFGLTTMLM